MAKTRQPTSPSAHHPVSNTQQFRWSQHRLPLVYQNRVPEAGVRTRTRNDLQLGPVVALPGRLWFQAHQNGTAKMAEIPSEVTDMSHLRDIVHCGVTMMMGRLWFLGAQCSRVGVCRSDEPDLQGLRVTLWCGCLLPSLLSCDFWSQLAAWR